MTADDGSVAQKGDFSEITEMPGHLLRRCQQIAVSIFMQECAGVTPLQYVALSALDHLGELDQNRLGGLVALDRTTIGKVVAKLEERGLVARRRSTTDRRFNAITCTPKGRALLAQVRPAVEAAQARILAPLAPAEQARFLGYLKRVAEGNNAHSRAPLRG
jgi:MarR family transcriptional regulator, lower aerobic nicotinate degradation pathway regulator